MATKDGLINVSQAVHAYLKERDVPHIWNVDDEGHTPRTWASNLYHFAQRIFPLTAGARRKRVVRERVAKSELTGRRLPLFLPFGRASKTGKRHQAADTKRRAEIVGRREIPPSLRRHNG
jgi:hypothetical protein